MAIPLLKMGRGNPNLSPRGWSHVRMNPCARGQSWIAAYCLLLPAYFSSAPPFRLALMASHRDEK
jgi:hypothetical protein